MSKKIIEVVKSRPKVFIAGGLIFVASIALGVYFLMPSNSKGVNGLALGESVDPSLITSSQAGYQYSAEASNYRATLPLDHSSGVEYGSPNSKQAFKTVPLFTTDAGVNDNGRIVYTVSEIEKHIYTFQKNGLKNDIVFDAKPQEDTKTYDYRLETQLGTAARLVEDGSVQILPDPKVGGLVYVMPRPYIVDSKGAKNFKDVNFRLKDNILSLEVRNLLQLQYPLSIDPSTYTVKATGGTITTVNPTSGVADGYVYHTFLSGGTFTPTVASLVIEYVLVAGGGGSGITATYPGSYACTDGGGGGGGVLPGSSAVTVAQLVSIGAGGGVQTNGSDSTFGPSGGPFATAYGGGGGNNQNGGSGGGASICTSAGGAYAGGTGVSGQGSTGGASSINYTGCCSYSYYYGGSGGSNGISYFGAVYSYGGGASGECYGYFAIASYGCTNYSATYGAANTGNGGGGYGGTGGSGKMVIRYPADPAIIIKTNTIIKSNTIIKP